MTEEMRITLFMARSLSRWDRLKLAISLVLAPLTLLLIGKSITVTVRKRDNG